MPGWEQPAPPGRAVASAPDVAVDASPSPAAATVIPLKPVSLAAMPQRVPVAAEPISVEQELEEWKRARRWQPPWRQISFVASISFGVASFALPGILSDAVQWLLIVLSAMGLVAWATGLARKMQPSREQP